jgi:DNA-binding response OmpR family regulator
MAMPRRILVIDDARDIVDLYREMFGSEGYQVLASFHPPSDPRDVEATQPDLIILDWMFGRHALGMATIAMLGAYRPTATIPVVVCSAAIHVVQPIAPLLAARGIPVVYKPFHVDDLLHTVARALPAPALLELASPVLVAS